ncbi:glyoxalase/bleomycin resistance/extradiol dioxygenase family protein [Pedobacter ginsengisoli]|uniref:Glyoxalase/bleomycin resistance/extradiol dioxygenase family protein n=1 Tax=Pedobacter ginsengisoli TaxID=363852 RepID=A0A2D1U303_9SPHI|nr:glyoxalase superfamily protein [Pedobacter ginsengisoli]ATP55985.1 glyoxalase/bleomycin resistance/extradiol dioxygenase family protein [Pedobacter ginsengisoli]
MTKIIPIFRAFDYAKAIEFYVEWLEAKIVFEHRPEASPFYIRVAIQDVEIDLSEHHGDSSPGAKISIQNFKGLQSFHSLLISKSYKYMNPGLEHSEWQANTLEMTVIDPFYNKIIFEEHLIK